MKQKTYIATQGPIPESISDFWRMVWEQDSRTIIMLTNPFEKGKLKCEVYWPREVGASTMHGNIEVTLTDMTQLADYTIRNFTVHKVHWRGREGGREGGRERERERTALNL